MRRVWWGFGAAVLVALGLGLWGASLEAEAQATSCAGSWVVGDAVQTCIAVGGVYQWVPVSRRLEGAGTLNFPSIVISGCSTLTMSPATLANVTTAYPVACFPAFDLTGGAFLAQSWMSAQGEVSIKVCSIGVITDPPSGLFGCVVAL